MLSKTNFSFYELLSDQAKTALSELNVEYSFLTKYAKNHTRLRKNIAMRVLTPPPVTHIKGNSLENKQNVPSDLREGNFPTNIEPLMFHGVL